MVVLSTAIAMLLLGETQNVFSLCFNLLYGLEV